MGEYRGCRGPPSSTPYVYWYRGTPVSSVDTLHPLPVPVVPWVPRTPTIPESVTRECPTVQWVWLRVLVPGSALQGLYPHTYSLYPEYHIQYPG